MSMCVAFLIIGTQCSSWQRRGVTECTCISPVRMPLCFRQCFETRSEKVQNERSPNFSNFDPKFAPKTVPNFPRIFQRVFALCFQRNGHHRKFTRNPRLFSTPNPQATSKKEFTQVCWRAGKVILKCLCA